MQDSYIVCKLRFLPSWMNSIHMQLQFKRRNHFCLAEDSSEKPVLAVSQLGNYMTIVC